jgi:hypothetical protein
MSSQRTLAAVPRRLAPILAFFALLVLLCDVAVVVVHVLDDKTTLIAGKPRVTHTETTEVQVVPAAGQAFVTGTLDTLAADNAQIEPLPTPLTIRGERGVSRVTIDKALMGGKRVTINWDGGTPMPLSGAGGGIDFGTAHVEVSGDGIVYSLDGAPRTFVAGTYSIGTSVAVGTSGVATPRDGVSFTADAQTVLVSKGNPNVKVDLHKIDLLGPGKLQASGKLKVQFPDRSVSATTVSFGEGPYRVTVDPAGTGVKVDAILQGRVDTN